MSKILSLTVITLLGLSVVSSLPHSRGLPLRLGQHLRSNRGLPSQVQHFDKDNNTAFDREELANYFKDVFDNDKYISQNVAEVFFVLDRNNDGKIDASEIEPLLNLKK